MRTVLDSNVFSVSHFDLLADSPLRKLSKVGRVVPIYSAVMLEETVHAYAVPRKREDLLGRWIPFILETAPRFCDDLPSVWHKELVQGRSSEAAMYMSPKKCRAVAHELAHIPADGSWDSLQAAAAEIRIEDERKRARRANSIDMRAEVAKLAKAAGVARILDPNVDLVSKTRNHLMSMLGPSLIQRFVTPSGWQGVASRWHRNKAAYPFFTQFVENAIFQETLFMTDHSAGVDLNAQADLDILTCLLQADALVTNETGFMRTAFERLWRPRGKIIFTSAEFASLLTRL